MILQQSRWTLWKKIDSNLIFLLVTITIVSLLNIYSATWVANSKSLSPLFTKQVTYYLVGWTLFFILTFSNIHYFLRLSLFFYALNLIFLIYTLLFGKTALGAQRWIQIGSFSYQPSETMKLVLVLALAKVLAQKRSQGQAMGVLSLFYPLIIIGLPFTLVVKQPDLGTALILAGIGGAMLLFYGIKKRILLSLGIIAAIALPFAWNYGLKDYQKKRVYTFLSPESDPRGSGYNSIQSKIAIGSGQIFGKGYLRGTQSKLEFLPEHHTDFIYSVLSEEHGFLGSLGVATLFALIFWVGLLIVQQSPDQEHLFVGIGCLAYLFGHALVNMGMVTGLLPVVGVPLPLFSYGGSSLLSSMICLGFLSSIAYRRYLF
jgi:rod shape determining protein RodA